MKNEKIDLKTIISNWDLYKNNDLNEFLLKDIKNINGSITSEDLKKFMSDYSDLASVIIEKGNIYNFINDIKNISTNELKKEYIKKFVDGVFLNNHPFINYKKYKELIKYSSLALDEEKQKLLKSSFNNDCLNVKDLNEHPEYMLYLDNETLENCFKRWSSWTDLKFRLEGRNQNFFQFLRSRSDFDTAKEFIIEELETLNSIIFPDIINSILEEFIDGNGSVEDFKKYIQDYIKFEFFMKGNKYPKEDVEEFKAKHPLLFISDDAPEILKDHFYSNRLSLEDLIKNSEYMLYLNDEQLENCFKEDLKYLKIKVKKSNEIETCPIYDFIRSKVDFNTIKKFLLEYGLLLKNRKTVYDISEFSQILFYENYTFDDIKKIVSEAAINNLLKEGEMYFNIIPEELKERYSQLFLPEEAPKELKEVFYNKNLDFEDFTNKPDLIKYFNKTNISCGFGSDLSWTALLYNDTDNIEEANQKRLKFIKKYFDIEEEYNFFVRLKFQDYILNYNLNVELEDIDVIVKVLSKLTLTNSLAFYYLNLGMASKILQTDQPLDTLDKMLDIFIEDTLPDVGKSYYCFEALYPDFKKFDFENYCNSSILKSVSDKSKKLIIFSDLIKAAFGSNNRSVNEYLKNLEFGSKMYEKIKNKEFDFNSLTEEEKEELIAFNRRLASLYNSSLNANLKNEIFKSTGKIEDDILELSKKLSPDGTLDYNLGDRIIRMFCGSIGINTLEEVKSYIDKKIKITDSKNREVSKIDMELNKGDFVKGINDIKFLKSTLQNGIVSKEFLGSKAFTDTTPLDVDLSMIMDSEGEIFQKFKRTAASNYGPIWLVMKNDDRFLITKNKKGEELEFKRDLSKIEAFCTGLDSEDHFGIRTAFASSEIDYILMEKYEASVGLEIAMNGFYIPVVDMEGKIIFTPDDYDDLREKMSGLTYYNENNYNFSENLINEDVEKIISELDKNKLETDKKSEKLRTIFKDICDDIGLKLKENIDGNLTEGFVELIDTGSTSRGTNLIGDYNYSFILKVDDRLYAIDDDKFYELKDKIINKLNLTMKSRAELTAKNVKIDNSKKVKVNIDICNRIDRFIYSTDMAVKDRLEQIKKLDSEKYKYVVANILLAKKILKRAKVYNPNRGDQPEGGLGGIGVENWILQNGGSFIDAAKNFVEVAEDKEFEKKYLNYYKNYYNNYYKSFDDKDPEAYTDFEKFKEKYKIWDFGESHLSTEVPYRYKHDEFIDNNMSEEGFEKMVKALKKYIKSVSKPSIKKVKK